MFSKQFKTCNKLKFSSSHKGTCQVISATKLKLTFDEANSSRTITGETTERPFMTPYSARKIKTVTHSLYLGCQMAEDRGLAVRGTDSIPAISPKLIKTSQLTFTSDSQVLADLNANLLVTFTPASTLKSEG